jgi:hypothetical protein
MKDATDTDRQTDRRGRAHKAFLAYAEAQRIPKNVKIKIYKTVTLPVVVYGCAKWSLNLREEHELRAFEEMC